jgi:hypothetical protein
VSARTHKPQRIVLGTHIPVKAYQYHGVTIRPHAHSAEWRRMYWVTDVGSNAGGSRCALRREIIAAAGYDPNEVSLPVSFPSMHAACEAIAKATGSAR